MRNLVKKHLNGRKILILFLLTGILYTTMLSITIPEVMSYSEGMKILDMMPSGYSTTYVNALLNALGERGRHAYLFNQLPLDMIFPFLFGITFCLVFAYFLDKLGKFESKLFYTCYLPLFAAFFDYAENIGIITMLKTYPDNSNLLTQITNVFSVVKSSSTTITFILLIMILLYFGIKKLFPEKQTNH